MFHFDQIGDVRFHLGLGAAYVLSSYEVHPSGLVLSRQAAAERIGACEGFVEYAGERVGSITHSTYSEREKRWFVHFKIDREAEWRPFLECENLYAVPIIQAELAVCATCRRTQKKGEPHCQCFSSAPSIEVRRFSLRGLAIWPRTQDDPLMGLRERSLQNVAEPSLKNIIL